MGSLTSGDVLAIDLLGQLSYCCRIYCYSSLCQEEQGSCMAYGISTFAEVDED